MKGISRSDLCCYCHSRARTPGRNVCSDRCYELRKKSYARSNAKRRGEYVSAPKKQWSLLTATCPGCGKIISAQNDCKCASWIAAPRPRHHDVVRVLNLATMKRGVEIK
jgi:hypothetical protein